MATIQGIYLALFGRPADPAGLAYFSGVTKNGADLSGIGNLAGQKEYTDRFSGQSNTQIINSIYQSLFGRDGESAGVTFWANKLASGALTINNIAIAILDGALGADKTVIDAKIAAADLFTSHLDLPAEQQAYGANTVSLARDYITTIGSTHAGTGTEVDAVIARMLTNAGQAPGGDDTSSGPPVDLAPIVKGESFDIFVDKIIRFSAKDLLANDVDPEGKPLSVTSVQDAVHGTVVINEKGIFFTPDKGFVGDAEFKYSVTDGVNTVSATAHVLVSDDAPNAGSDVVSATQYKALTISVADLMANDQDPLGKEISFVSVQDAEHGAVSLDSHGDIVFVPDGDYTGDGSFTYTITNGEKTSVGSVTINISPTEESDTTINFDDLDSNTGGIPLPTSHAGLNWTNIYYTNAIDIQNVYATNGYTNGYSSAPNVAFVLSNSTGTISASQAFDLESLDIGAAWNDGMTVEIRGYKAGILLGSQTAVPLFEKGTIINLDDTIFDSVDKVEIQVVADGNQHPGIPFSGTQLVLDDIHIVGLTPIPV